MTAIHIHKHLDSETLSLPELRPLLGKNVEIVVTEDIKSTCDAELRPLPIHDVTTEELSEEGRKMLDTLDAVLNGAHAPPVIRRAVGTREERLAGIMEIGPIDIDEEAIRELRRLNTL